MTGSTRQTRGTKRIRFTLATLTLLLLVAACGGRGPVDHPAAEGDAPTGGEPGWWLFEDPAYRLVGGGVTPADIGGSTGSLWRLEYSNGPRTIQLVADQAGGLFAELSAGSPEIGSTTVQGVTATLRQHPGRPQDGIAPSVGAEWTDGEVFISFGGPGLTEAETRDALTKIRRVTQAEWAEAAKGLDSGVPPPDAPTPPAGETPE